MVYSIVDKDSFIKAQDILQYLAKQSCNDKRAIILVGNKVDLQRSRQVSIQGKDNKIYKTSWCWALQKARLGSRHSDTNVNAKKSEIHASFIFKDE